MLFFLLINVKMPTVYEQEKFHAQLSSHFNISLINVKMPTVCEEEKFHVELSSRFNIYEQVKLHSRPN